MRKIILFLGLILTSYFGLAKDIDGPWDYYLSFNIKIKRIEHAKIAYSIFPKSTTNSDNSSGFRLCSKEISSSTKNYAQYITIPNNIKVCTPHIDTAIVNKKGVLAIYNNFNYLIAEIFLYEDHTAPKNSEYYDRCIEKYSSLGVDDQVYVCYKINQYSTIEYPKSEKIEDKGSPYELNIIVSSFEPTEGAENTRLSEMNIDFNYTQAF